MKRIRIAALLLLLAILSTLSLSLSSCAESYDEDEVIEASRTLLKNSEALNTVFFGHGIAYVDSNYSNGDYKEASTAHLAKLGFSTLAELRTLTYSTYTDSYAESVLNLALNPLYNMDGEIQYMAKYAEAFYDAELTQPYILVYSKIEDVRIIFEDRMTFDYTSVRADGIKDGRVKMWVEVTVENEDGNKQSREISFSIKKENEKGYRLTGPVFTNYKDN